jgi:hypothetical protein
MKKIGLSIITSLILTGNLYSGNYDFGCNSDDDVTVAMNKFKEKFDKLTKDIKKQTNGSNEQKTLMEERSTFLENEKPKLEKLKKAMKCATYEAEFNKNYKTDYKDQESSKVIHLMLKNLKTQSPADQIIKELEHHQIPALKSWGVDGLYGYEINLEKKGLVINLLTLNGLKKIDTSSDYSYSGKDGVGIDGNKIIVRTKNKSYSLSPDSKYRDNLAKEIADALKLKEINVLKSQPIPTNNEDEKENGENTTNQAKDDENKKENGENKKDSVKQTNQSVSAGDGTMNNSSDDNNGNFYTIFIKTVNDPKKDCGIFKSDQKDWLKSHIQQDPLKTKYQLKKEIQVKCSKGDIKCPQGDIKCSQGEIVQLWQNNAPLSDDQINKLFKGESLEIQEKQ